MQEEPSSLKKSYKFIRRPDITLPLRMKLDSLLFCFNYYEQVGVRVMAEQKLTIRI
ncbi:MAG: hypothetical protein AB8G86_10175 [Saprospiraceae bacterium]